MTSAGPAPCWSAPFAPCVARMSPTPNFGAHPGTAAILFPLLILGLVILSLLRRDRSLQDRIAGTWLVPK